MSTDGAKRLIEAMIVGAAGTGVLMAIGALASGWVYLLVMAWTSHNVFQFVALFALGMFVILTTVYYGDGR